MVNTRASGKLRKTRKTKVCEGLLSPPERRKWPQLDYSLRKKKEKDGKSGTSDLIRSDQGLLSVGGEQPTDEGVAELGGDSVVSNCSLESGPSHTYSDETPHLCSSCLKVYERAKKIKAMKNKLLDNDPCSLSCDQWVLLKRWRVSRRPNTKGKLHQHVCRIITRFKYQGPKQNQRESGCSRPHAFLQRNLSGKRKSCFTNRKNKRKRSRQTSQGPRSAKQQRLHGNDRQTLHHSTNNTQNSGTLNSTGFWDGDGDGEPTEEPNQTCMVLECKPSSISTATSQSRDLSGQQKNPQQQSGFRGLLAQLSLHNSTIVQESWKK